jgi:hypothetical protein
MLQKHRISTNIGKDQKIVVELKQDYDLLELLSLKFTQKEIYSSLCSDYGVVCGRVTANNGLGIPNAKVSIFVPLSTLDEDDPVISALYPYKIGTDKNEDGYRYNLLPSRKQHGGHVPIGTFPDQEEILGREEVLEVYEKYYNYTVKTNDAGDFMIWGVPTGLQSIHVDVDLSDMGCFSLRPYDFIRQGEGEDKFDRFYNFKSSNDIDGLVQIVTFDKTIDVYPFWGSDDFCEIGITRTDFDLSQIGIKIEPISLILASNVTDENSQSLKRNGRIRKNSGFKCNLQTSEGTIECVRFTGKKVYSKDNTKLYPELEFYELSETFDQNGSAMIVLPMNSDYVFTNEFGEQEITNDSNKGIPTTSIARFRFSLSFSNEKIATANYLVPNIREFNPNTSTGTNDKYEYYQSMVSSYIFSDVFEDYIDPELPSGTTTLNTSGYTSTVKTNKENLILGNNDIPQDYFYKFVYGKVYTVSSFQGTHHETQRRDAFLGFKEIRPNTENDCASQTNYFPVNFAYKNRIKFNVIIATAQLFVQFIFAIISVKLAEIVGRFFWGAYTVFWNIRILGVRIFRRFAELCKDLAYNIQAKNTIQLPLSIYPDCEECTIDDENLTLDSSSSNSYCRVAEVLMTIEIDEDSEPAYDIVFRVLDSASANSFKNQTTDVTFLTDLFPDDYARENEGLCTGTTIVSYSDLDNLYNETVSIPGSSINSKYYIEIYSAQSSTLPTPTPTPPSQISVTLKYSTISGDDACSSATTSLTTLPVGRSTFCDVLTASETITSTEISNYPSNQQFYVSDGQKHRLFQKNTPTTAIALASCIDCSSPSPTPTPTPTSTSSSGCSTGFTFDVVTAFLSNGDDLDQMKIVRGGDGASNAIRLSRNRWKEISGVDSKEIFEEYDMSDDDKTPCTKAVIRIYDRSINRSEETSVSELTIEEGCAKYDTAYDESYVRAYFFSTGDTYGNISIPDITTGTSWNYGDGYYEYSGTTGTGSSDNLLATIIGASNTQRLPRRVEYIKIPDRIYDRKTRSGLSEIRDGVFTIIPVVNGTSYNLKAMLEWYRRKRIGIFLCGGVINYTFIDNWLNGILYFFKFDKKVRWDNLDGLDLNQRGTKFPRELIFYNIWDRKFYYRSTPYDGTTQKFIGQDFYGDGNLQILHPTTFYDVGVRDEFLKEICTDPTIDPTCSVVRDIGNTSYQDPANIVEYNVNYKLDVADGKIDIDDFFVNEGYANFGFSLLAVTNPLFLLLKNRIKILDGDMIQMFSINSEVGIEAFDTDSQYYFMYQGEYLDPENSYYKPYFTSGGAVYGPLPIDFKFDDNGEFIRSCLNFRLGDYSQVVPFYLWNKKGTGFGPYNSNRSLQMWDRTQIASMKLQRIFSISSYSATTTNYNFNDGEEEYLLLPMTITHNTFSLTGNTASDNLERFDIISSVTPNISANAASGYTEGNLWLYVTSGTTKDPLSGTTYVVVNKTWVAQTDNYVRDYRENFIYQTQLNYSGEKQVLSTPFLFYFGLTPQKTSVDKLIKYFGPKGAFTSS